jgi:hypothetical protein
VTADRLLLSDGSFVLLSDGSYVLLATTTPDAPLSGHWSVISRAVSQAVAFQSPDQSVLTQAPGA